MATPFLTVAPYRTIASRVAASLASSRSDSHPLAPWNAEVIVASHGMAQSIATSLLDHFPAGFAQLRLQPVETLALRILNQAGEYPRVASAEERRLAMRTVTGALDEPLTASRGAAAMLERSYRDVRDSGITLSEFSGRAASVRTLRSRERVRVALRAWLLYERLVAQLQAVDPADVLTRAADLIASGVEVRPQIVAGFYDMTGAQLGVLRALQAVGKVAAVDVPGNDPFALPFLREFQSCPSPPASPSSPVDLRASATREEEIRDVCSRVAGLIASGAPPHAIGVVARSLDPYDVSLLARFAAQSGFVFNDSPPLPLYAHRFGRAVLLLLRLRERSFARGDVLEIVRSGIRLATTLDADQVDSETRRASLAGGRSLDLRRRTFRSPLLEDYIAAVEEMESLTERIDESWLPRLLERFRPASAADAAALDQLQGTGALFQRAAAWKRPFDVHSLIDAIESAEIPPAKSRGQNPVWMGDVMRLRGHFFEHLFFIRMQDDLMPQRRVEDPLLRDSDRRQLGIRQVGDGRDEEAMLFRLTCQAGGQVHISFAAGDGFGKPLRMSHYLRGVPKAPGEAAPLPETRPAPQRALQLLVRAGTRGVFDGSIDSALVRERSRLALQSLSPTHLEDFGECPQKFWLKRLLGVRDLQAPEMKMQIDHREKGSVDHKILERFYREIGQATLSEAMDALPVLPERITAILDRIIDEEFQSLEERIPPFNVPVRRIEHEATRRDLREFLALDLADLSAQSLTPRRFEYRFDPLVIDVDGTPLRIEGTIDRLDEGQGRVRIVDYKSGKAARHAKLAEKIDRGVRLQLALYALAMDADGATQPEVSGVIKPLAGAAKPADFSFELASRKGRLLETLALFVSAIQEGRFFAFPNEKDNDYNACKYCPVNHSCRTRHDGEEKRAVLLRASDPRAALAEEPA